MGILRMSWQSRCKLKMSNAPSQDFPWSAVAISDHRKHPDAVLLSYRLSTTQAPVLSRTAFNGTGVTPSAPLKS